MTTHKHKRHIAIVSQIFAAALLTSVSGAAIAQSVDANVSADDGVSASVSVSAGGTTSNTSASTGGSSGTSASTNVGVGDTDASVDINSNGNGTNADVSVNSGLANADVNAGTGEDGTAADVTVDVGNTTGNVNVDADGGSADADVSVEQASQISSLSKLSDQQISAAIQGLGSSQTAKLRQTCDAILAAPSKYSAESVEVCKVIIAL
ncbi:MAG: hypothetical protein V7703_11260 [Hyphomicrobiales bacterium]